MAAKLQTAEGRARGIRPDVAEGVVGLVAQLAHLVDADVRCVARGPDRRCASAAGEHAGKEPGAEQRPRPSWIDSNSTSTSRSARLRISLIAISG